MTSTIIAFTGLTSLVAYDYFFSHKIFGKKVFPDEESSPQTASGVPMSEEGTPNFKKNNDIPQVVPRVTPSPRPDFHNFGAKPPKSPSSS
ncbi:unnamed protein product [Blepharisma stoltei]|uniref:Uncharacterized protein n=1 Tax=Blepharisma stoltei TaxID=1481888 RepID=A0AAU9JYT8_9CILI|nr:unnamed protein product [Blepharisma stoltei]